MAKSKEELIYDIENELVDPTTNKITGERVKARLLDMVDAMGSGGNMEYWSVPEEASTEVAILTMLTSWVKIQMGDSIYIGGSALVSLSSSVTLVAFAVDPAANLVLAEMSGTFYEFLPQMGISSLADAGCVQITKEEFYAF